MNENPIDIKLYPPDKRWMVTFTSEHLLTTGEWGCYQNQRRFILADSPNEAREHFRLGVLADPKYWPKEFHKWHNLQVCSASNIPAWAGYCRFGIDIRAKKELDS